MTYSVDITRHGRKVKQVIDGARQVFLRCGFDGAGVDEIARAAQVSKATLYSYFPDKREMFMEVARVECLRQANSTMEMIDPTRGIAEALRVTGRNILKFMTSDFGRKVFRICVAEAERFPEVGKRFYDSGPQLVRDRMVEFLKTAIARGELEIEDIELAADQFVELCKADIFHRLVFCRDWRPTEADLERVIDGAVATFMARYGANGKPASAPG